MLFLLRTKSAEDHADYWKVMKGQLGLSLKWAWEELSEAGVKQAVFVRSYQEALSLYHDPDELMKIVQAEQSVESVAESIKKVVGESCVGKAMFTIAWIKASRVFFRREIDKGIRQLIDHNFDENEMQSFKHLMAQQCNSLVDTGHKRFERICTEVVFLGKPVNVYVETPEDEWEFRLACAVKGCCINSGQESMLPWESLLCKAGEVPNTPASAKVSEKLVDHYASARSAAKGFLGSECVQLSEMIKVILSKRSHLIKLDRSFQCDLVFLEKKSEELLRSQLNTAVLDCLPSEGKEVTLLDASKSLAALKASAQYLACSPAVQGELSSVESLICNLLSNYGPRLKSLDQYSKFFRLVLKRVERFYVVKTTQPGPSGAKGGKLAFNMVKAIYGEEALRLRFAEIRDVMESDKPSGVALADLMPFKLYTWLLRKDENRMLQGWITTLSSDLCSRSALTDKGKGAGGSTGMEVQTMTAAMLSAGSASSSSGSMGQVPSYSSAASKTEKKQEDSCVNMMKFFVGKTK